MRFRKRQPEDGVEVDAIQYTGDNFLDVADFAAPGHSVEDSQYENDDGITIPFANADKVVVRTPDGDVTVMPGDWLIREWTGEFHLVKPSVFEATHEVL